MTDSLDNTQLEEILSAAIEDAAAGTLTDTHRVMLYRLALTVAGNEFHRIENTAAGSVSPEVLVFLQQIALLADDETSLEKLRGAAASLTGDTDDEAN